jgi:hypothetical protein
MARSRRPWARCKRVEFHGFHGADFIVILQNGKERLLKTENWKGLPDWTVHATADGQIENRLRT